MKKLGSEFLDDFEKEKNGFLRKIILYTSFLFFLGIILAVEYLELPEIIYYIYLFLVVIPCFSYGADIHIRLKVKDRLYYLFLEKRRIFKQDEKLEKGE